MDETDCSSFLFLMTEALYAAFPSWILVPCFLASQEMHFGILL